MGAEVFHVDFSEVGRLDRALTDLDAPPTSLAPGHLKFSWNGSPKTPVKLWMGSEEGKPELFGEIPIDRLEGYFRERRSLRYAVERRLQEHRCGHHETKYRYQGRTCVACGKVVRPRVRRARKS